MFTEEDAADVRVVPLASDTAPSDKPAPDALSEEVPDAVLNAWAREVREQGEPGLYVTGHRILGIGPVHTAIEYIAGDGTRHWISAGPDRRGRLVSGVDERERPSDKPEENFALGVITLPPGTSDQAYFQELVDTEKAYGDDADYDRFPELMNGYNSNGFVRGLLDHTGGSYTVDFDRLIGGDSPLPAVEIESKPPRPNGPRPRRRIRGPHSSRRR